MKYYERIRDLREDNDMNQNQIAELLNTSASKISDYENGNIMMRIDKYIKLARFYNVSLDYLTGLIDVKRPLDEKAHIKVHTLTPKEKALIKAYKNNPQIQYVIDKILDL